MRLWTIFSHSVNFHASSMVFHEIIADKIRAYVKFHGDTCVKKSRSRERRQLVKWLSKECRISERSVYRLMSEAMTHDTSKSCKRKEKAGRKRLISEKHERLLIRKVAKIRDINKNWKTTEIMELAGIPKTISTRTVQRVLHKNGYGYLIARRKGVLSEEDTKKRVRFSKEMLRKGADFWKHNIAFYFDGSGFPHKTRPKEQAESCGKYVWRKRSEGRHRQCTAKGKKEGNGVQARFFVAISYDRGVVFAEQYEKLDGHMFSNFVRKHFPTIFQRCGKDSRLWIQDGDPSQNSQKAIQAMGDVNAQLFSIPPRSPELNPIENLFAFVKKELVQQALHGNIERESFKDFSTRVKATLYSSSVTRINNLISSYHRRLIKIKENKGCRIPY